MGVVYYGNYMQYLEIGRVEAMRQLGVSYKTMEAEDGLLLPVVEVNIKYLRSALYDELLTVVTVIKELPVAHEIVFYSEIFNEKNKLLTTAEVRLFFMNKFTHKKILMPKRLEEKLKAYF
jgi:acyl-CoA thioester hydrolase